LDRFVTFFRATKASGRLFAADHYTAFVLHMIKGEVPTIPHPSAKEVRVFGPRGQKRPPKVAYRYAHNEIGLEEILREPSRYVMIFRPSMLGKDFKDKLPAGVRCIYSYWTGYLDKPDFQAARAKVEEAGGEFIERHTSGHIFSEDTVKFVKTMKPERVVPIHTTSPSSFSQHFSNVHFARDGESIDI
jgi:ribonuclease J